MDIIISWILSHVFTWTALLAVILGFVRKPVEGMNRSAHTLRYLLLWYVGIAFAWSGYAHVLMPNFTAGKIGWAPSPFQFEVGLANWSIAILGIMAFFKRDSYLWLAVILSLMIFSVGAGVGHVFQLIAFHNTSPFNAGSIMYVDIIVPVLMLILWFRADQ